MFGYGTTGAYMGRYPVYGVGLPPGANQNSLPWCGGIKPLQQMLSDLGFYAGRIDGSVGTGTTNAIVAAQRQYGVPTGAISKGFCAALADAWNAKMAAPSPTPGAPAPGAPAAPSPGVPTEAPPNGAMVMAEPQGVMDKWAALPMAAKAGILGGTLLLVGGGIYLVVR
jgi:peptidoglycan hydrolase-like protein with peptidoglycan-binding domain